jgi:hypothetical protein
LDFLGATIGTDREVEPTVGVGRPEVIAEQRRAPSSQLRTNKSRIDKAVGSECGNAALDWSDDGQAPARRRLP